jgi:hypothetical protein
LGFGGRGKFDGVYPEEMDVDSVVYVCLADVNPESSVSCRALVGCKNLAGQAELSF